MYVGAPSVPLGGADHAPTSSTVAFDSGASASARSTAALAEGDPSVAVMIVGMTASLLHGFACFRTRLGAGAAAGIGADPHLACGEVLFSKPGEIGADTDARA